MKAYIEYLSQGSNRQKNFQYSLDYLVNQHSIFLCSLSGGQDSISLFFLLFHFLNNSQQVSQKETSLTVFYCHHFWQPKNIYLVSFLFQLSLVFQCEFFVSFSKKIIPNENRSRRLRKKSLSRISILQNTTRLLTGHTETDRIETLFTNFMRGTTVKNLNSTTFFNFKKEESFLFSPFNKNFINLFCLQNIVLVAKTFKGKDMVFKKARSCCLIFSVFYFQESCFSNNQVLSKLERSLHVSLLQTSFSDHVGRKKSKRCIKKFPPFSEIKEQKRQSNDFFYFPRKEKQFQFWNRKQISFSFFQKKDPTSLCLAFGEVSSLNIRSHKLKVSWNKPSLVPHFQSNCGIEVNFKPGCQKNAWKTTKLSSSSFSLYGFSSVDVFWFKPFISTKRLFIRNCLDFYRLPALTDLTNFSYHFSRNKIRHHFLPFLKRFSHEKMEKGVVQCFKIHGDEHDIIEIKVRELVLISLVVESIFVPQLPKLERKPFSKLLRSTISDSLQLAFLQSLLLKYKNRDGTFFQISSLKTRVFSID